MIYIALLRGINVGGKNKMPMAELRKTLEGIGLSRVSTYIQSGNVLFESSEGEEALRRKIGEGLMSAFGFAPAIVLRTVEQFRAVVDGYPFSAAEIEASKASASGESLYVTLLEEEPAAERIDKLRAGSYGADRFRVSGRDIYLLFAESVRNSKLAANVEKLGVAATTRNWNTIGKLLQLAGEMERQST